jgi:hypothetical protein
MSPLLERLRFMVSSSSLSSSLMMLPDDMWLLLVLRSAMLGGASALTRLGRCGAGPGLGTFIVWDEEGDARELPIFRGLLRGLWLVLLLLLLLLLLLAPRREAEAEKSDVVPASGEAVAPTRLGGDSICGRRALGESDEDRVAGDALCLFLVLRELGTDEELHRARAGLPSPFASSSSSSPSAFSNSSSSNIISSSP